MLMSVAHVERGKRERELLCFCSVQNTKVWDTKEGGDDGQSALSAGLFIIALTLHVPDHSPGGEPAVDLWVP